GAQTVVCFGEVRFARESFLKFVRRCAGAAFSQECISEIEMSVRIFGLRLQDGLEFGDGFVDFAALKQDEPEIVSRHELARLNLERRSEFADGFAYFFLAHKRVAEI